MKGKFKMINTDDIAAFIKGNEGKTVQYGEGYYIQVYNGTTLQANISYKQEDPFLKIEQRSKCGIDIFLEKADEAGRIDYSKSCTLPYGGNISGLFNEFGQHPQIERALIALLELH